VLLKNAVFLYRLVSEHVVVLGQHGHISDAYDSCYYVSRVPHYIGAGDDTRKDGAVRSKRL
jgi:hypothetical protein